MSVNNFVLCTCCYGVGWVDSVVMGGPVDCDTCDGKGQTIAQRALDWIVQSYSYHWSCPYWPVSDTQRSEVSEPIKLKIEELLKAGAKV